MTPPCRLAATLAYRANRAYGFPLWGKLSPQVTDEGASAGHFPLIRRVPRHLPPKGEGFSAAAVPVNQPAGKPRALHFYPKNCFFGKQKPMRIFRIGSFLMG